MEKKEHKFLKVMLLIILILLMIFVLNTVRNYFILSDLFEKQAKLSDVTNASFVSEFYIKGDETKTSTIEHYRKDSKMMTVVKNDTPTITWHDEDTKESIILSTNTFQGIISDTTVGVTFEIPRIIHNEEENTKGYRLFCSALSIILPETVNGEKCYYINLSGYQMWVNKETGLRVKEYNGTVEKDGVKYDQIIEYKDYKFDELTDEDLARPNLIGYTMKDERSEKN